jgi:hypothetical protein
MAYEDPNAPSPSPAPASAPTTASTVSTTATEKKPGSWDWIWPSILAVIIVKLFGLVGGLVTFGSYYILKPKIGTWGAVAASGVIGTVVAVGLLAMIR